MYVVSTLDAKGGHEIGIDKVGVAGESSGVSIRQRLHVRAYAEAEYCDQVIYFVCSWNGKRWVRGTLVIVRTSTLP